MILAYHRIGPDVPEILEMRVRTDRFAEHVRRAQRHAEVVPLSDLLTPSREPRIAFTFDDGYADNLYEAKPVLDAAGVVATMFVVTEMIGSVRGYWQDRLFRVLFAAPPFVEHVEVEVDGRALWVHLGSRAARERAFHAFHARLRPQRTADIEATLDELAARLGVETDSSTAGRILDEDELSTLVADSTIEVGSHSLDHAMLSRLSPEEQQTEIAGSRAALERMIDRPVRSFAYPFGGADHFDETSVSLVQEAGYTLAVTLARTAVTRRSDPFRLPRFPVPNVDGDEFDALLSNWLADRALPAAFRHVLDNDHRRPGGRSCRFAIASR